MPLPRPETPIKLYRALLSGHSHRVALFLSLLGLPYETIEVDLRAGAHKQPAFLAKTPFGQVPVIEDGAVTLYDSNAILTYLALTYDDGTWYPRDPLGAAKVQAWFSLAAGPLRYGPCEARLVTVFGAKLDADKAKAISANLFKILDADLIDKPFALGDRPSVADVAAYGYIARAPEGGIALDPYPAIGAWLARIEALPGFVPFPSAKTGLSA